MISRFNALILIETDILLSDDRSECVKAVLKKINRIYDSFENSNEVWQSAYQQGLNERKVLDKNNFDDEDETRL